MAEIIIETPRMILRTEAPGDLAIFLEHMNTPHVQEHLRGVKEPHEVEAAFARMALNASKKLSVTPGTRALIFT